MHSAKEIQLIQARELATITTKSDALVLLRRWRSKSAWLLKQPKIIQLVDHSPDVNKEKTEVPVDYYYKFFGRRPSFCLEIDWKNGLVTDYNPREDIGDGVRKFSNVGGKTLVIKQYPPKDRFVRLTKKKVNAVRDRMANEASFIKQANKEESIIQHFVATVDRGNDEQDFTSRIIMPMVSGKTAGTVFEENLSKCQAIYLVLEMTKTLLSLHNKGIIHGDIKEDNLLIDILDSQHAKVTWIDFGCAYRLDGNGIITTKEECTYWAPERVSPQKKVKPHTNQDVFSYGKMLQTIIENNTALKILTSIYPSLERFIQQALEITPENRPALPAFYAELYTEYLRETDVITLVGLLTTGDGFEQQQAAKQLASRVLSGKDHSIHHATLYAIRGAAHGITRLKELLTSHDTDTKQYATTILNADEALDKLYVETFCHAEVRTLVKLLASEKVIIQRHAVKYLTDRVLQESLTHDDTTLQALRNVHDNHKAHGIFKLRALSASTNQEDIKQNIMKILDAYMAPLVATAFSPRRTNFFRTLLQIHDIEITNPISRLFNG